MSGSEDEPMTSQTTTDELANTADSEPSVPQQEEEREDDTPMFDAAGEGDGEAKEQDTIVLPKCEHVKTSIDRNLLQKKSKAWKKWNILSCHRCKGQTHQPNLVLCLQCGNFFCSRATAHQHGAEHYENTKHRLCMMVQDKTVWCYECDAWMSEMGMDDNVKIRKARNLVQQHINRIQNKVRTKEARQNNQRKGGGNRNNNRRRYDEEFPRGWNAADQDVEEDGVIGVCGLRNLGNTCFFNSVVQNLCAARPFVSTLLRFHAAGLHEAVQDDQKTVEATTPERDAADSKQADVDSPAMNTRSRTKARQNKSGGGSNKGGKKGNKAGTKLMDEFTKLVLDMQNNKTRSVSPNALHRAVAARNSMFANMRQHDSHELMRTLVEGIREQNAKYLMKIRKDRVNSRVSEWTHEQLEQWFDVHDIEISEEALMRLSVLDFASFVRKPSAFGIDRFLGIVEMTKKEERCRHMSQAIRDLNAERCSFYKDLYPTAHERSEHEEQTVIDVVFCGKMESSVTCQACGSVSKNLEDFYDLSLPIAAPEANPSVYGHYRAWTNNRRSKKNKGGKKGRGRRRRTPTPPPPEAAVEENDNMPAAATGMARLKPETVSLQDALLAYTDPEILEGADAYGCWQCTKNELNITSDVDEDKEASGDDDFSEKSHLDSGDRRVDLVKKPAIKRYLLSHAPKVLTVHLKRFEQRGYRVNKTSKRVTFDVEMDLSEIATDECRNASSCRYQLFGVSRHMGSSMGGGHYVAYTRKYRSRGISHGWYYISDSHFRAVELSEVLGSEAYILFYERIDDPREDQTPEGEDVDTEMEDVDPDVAMQSVDVVSD